MTKKNANSKKKNATTLQDKPTVETPVVKVAKNDLAAKELAFMAKYPERGIVPGSLLPADVENNPFPGKETIEITCIDTGAHRRIATQDLFQVSRSVEATKAYQRKMKLEKRNASPEAQARKARFEAEKAAREEKKAAKVKARQERESARLAAKEQALKDTKARLETAAAKLRNKAETVAV